MKGKKCFGLFLVLFIMLGVSLGVSSGDSSALSYKVQSIPFFVPAYSIGDAFYSPLSLDVRSVDSGYYDNMPEVWAYNTSWNSTAEKCFYTGGSTYNNFFKVLVNDGADIYSQGYYAPSWFDYSYMTNQNNRYSYERCHSPVHFQNWISYNTLPVPAINSSQPDYRRMMPYWYDYDGAFVYDSYTEDGLNRRTKLDFEELFGAAPTKFKSLTIPLGISHNTLGDLTINRPISVSGAFYFDSANPDTDVLSFASDTTPYFNLLIKGFSSVSDFESQSSRHSQTVPCVYNIRQNTVEGEYPYIFEYSCSGYSSYLFLDGYYGLTIQFGTSTGSYLWDYPAIRFVMDSNLVITDNDSTPASVPYGEAVTGNTDEAPGSASDNPSASTDWFSSLVNLFNFNFINPFAPLFEMFTDNSECASIPIIAGMLGSTETQYCPWFDSDTRSVLTPVLSIASIMLLFGFLVRWLSSSSGNMFEDQTTHKWGNTQFKQKGGN